MIEEDVEESEKNPLFVSDLRKLGMSDPFPDAAAPMNEADTKLCLGEAPLDIDEDLLQPRYRFNRGAPPGVVFLPTK